jgi:hypothetical protein
MSEIPAEFIGLVQVQESKFISDQRMLAVDSVPCSRNLTRDQKSEVVHAGFNVD